MTAEHRDSAPLPAQPAVIALAPTIAASASAPTCQPPTHQPRSASSAQLPAPYRGVHTARTTTPTRTTTTAPPTTTARTPTAATTATAAATPAAPTPAAPTTATTARTRSTRTERSGGNEFFDGLEALVEQARAGHPRAMTELIRRFTPLVRAVVRRAGIYGVEAEDVEQETWLRLATNLDRVREPAALPRWLSVTAGRLCTSLFDKRRRVQPTGDFSEDTWLSTERLADPADMVCLRDEVVRLYDAIETLGPRDRTLVKLLMDATPYREISATIAMPVGSIGPTRERVLRKLAGSAALRKPPVAPAHAPVPVAAA